MDVATAYASLPDSLKRKDFLKALDKVCDEVAKVSRETSEDVAIKECKLIRAICGSSVGEPRLY